MKHNKYHIQIQRELDEPANIYMDHDDYPSDEEIEKAFVDEGYEDDWDCCRATVTKIF